MKMQVLKGSFVVLSLLFGLWGCGDNGGGVESDFSSLNPYLKALNDRLNSHRAFVQGALESSTKALDGVLSGEDWDALHEEHGNYEDDMHGYLDELGSMITHIGNCQMLLGGMMYGPHGAGTCPCQPYMGGAIDELDHHLSEMLFWMGLHDPDGLWEEMSRHMEQMDNHLLEMREHMQGLYGHSHHHHSGGHHAQ